MRFATSLGAAAATLALAAFADPPPPATLPPPAAQTSTTVAPVVVTASPTKLALQRRVARYVAAITVHSDLFPNLVRWHEPVCPLVGGMPKEQAEFLLERVSEVARNAGAALGPANCHPNIFIIAAAQPTRLLTGWQKKQPHLFGGAYVPMVNRFLHTPRPVRVWYNARVANVNGIPLAVSAGEIPQNQFVDDTRLAPAAIEIPSSVLVIVDVTKLRGVTLAQLADYIAMTSLAEIDPDAKVGDAPTILRLFQPHDADNPPPDSMTGWDAAFLKAAYDLRPSVNETSQISGRVVSDVTQ